MNRSALDHLKRELGCEPPAAFKELDAQALAHLAGAMSGARTRQKQQLDEALTRALEHVPMLMRGPIRKILGL